MFNIGESVSYATVWQPVIEERRVKCNLSSSKKLKTPTEDGKEFENSSWLNAVFVGKAFEKAKKHIKERDNIKITSGTVDNTSFVGADGVKKFFNHVVIFDFEIMVKEGNGNGDAPQKPTSPKGSEYSMVDDDDADVPY